MPRLWRDWRTGWTPRLPVPAGPLVTESRLAVLCWLVQCQAEHRPPSVREVCEHFGWTSTNSARVHLRELEHDELITRRGRRARSVYVTDKGRSLVLVRRQAGNAEANS